jgi:hypothetical protein
VNHEGLVLDAEDEPSGCLLSPDLKPSLEGSDLSGFVLVRIARLQLSKKFASRLVGITFEVLAQFRPVCFKGVSTSPPRTWESGFTVRKPPDDDSSCDRRNTPDPEKIEQRVPLPARIAPWIFRLQLIE